MPTNSGISSMRSQVSRLGMLSGNSGPRAAHGARGLHAAGSYGLAHALVQILIDFFRQRAADAFHLRQFVDARRNHAFQPAEARQQALPALGADTSDRLERRAHARLAAPRAMPFDGKAMRFVANLLDQVQPEVIARQL